MQDKKVYKNSNTLWILLVAALLILSATITGIVLTMRSTQTAKDILWRHLLSVANTAAELIDGDDVRQITEADTPLLDENGHRKQDGSERCSRIENVLVRVKNAQKDMNIPYIYIVRYEDGRFVFIVDPELEDPGEYGQEVVQTPAQVAAWAGAAGVDEEPYTDEWGTFYSAWSPITDSSGRVVGLVGVDFDAKQITDQTHYGVRFIVLCTVSLLLISLAVILLYSRYTRRRFRVLDSEITELSGNLRTIFDEIDGIQQSDQNDSAEEETRSKDYLDYVRAKTSAMTKRLRDHTAHMQQLANVDFLTRVGNVRALSQKKAELLPAIEQKTADFAVGVFDIDRLKQINDSYGHEQGDVIIQAAADVLKRAFLGQDLFRSGGDEFTAVFCGVNDKQLELLFRLLEQEIDKKNASLDPSGLQLSLSKGFSVYDPATDSSFRDVFIRADRNMYASKHSDSTAIVP